MLFRSINYRVNQSIHILYYMIGRDTSLGSPLTHLLPGQPINRPKIYQACRATRYTCREALRISVCVIFKGEQQQIISLFLSLQVFSTNTILTNYTNVHTFSATKNQPHRSKNYTTELDAILILKFAVQRSLRTHLTLIS